LSQYRVRGTEMDRPRGRVYQVMLGTPGGLGGAIPFVHSYRSCLVAALAKRVSSGVDVQDESSKRAESAG